MYIILTDDFDEKNYVFRIENRSLIFDQSQSDGDFRVDDGTVFERKGLFDRIVWPFG